ncbi:MAG: GNAT family protein [Thermoleophilia bacterium]
MELPPHLAPLMGLRLRAPGLELRLPELAELEALARDAASAGVLDPRDPPFVGDWTDHLGEPGSAEAFVAYHLDRRRAVRPEEWRLELGVFAGGRLVGIQGIGARELAGSRCVGTGSWLLRTHQGRGLGTRMRAAVLALGFTHLDATTAETRVLDGNGPSQAVSRKLGYVPAAGGRWETVRGRETWVARYVLTRARWRRHPGPPLEVDGLEACLHMLGAPR